MSEKQLEVRILVYNFDAPRSAIVHVEPRQLQVGDKVTWGSRERIYTIRAIDNEYAWLNFSAPLPCDDEVYYCTMELKKLELVSK